MNALIAAGFAASILAIDQWTKAWALRSRSASLNPRGGVAALSVSGAVLVFVALLAATLAAITLIPDLPAAGAAGLGLASGGGAGNLSDRIRRGAVVDFIRAGRWPAFNVADIALTAALPLCLSSLAPW